MAVYDKAVQPHGLPYGLSLDRIMWAGVTGLVVYLPFEQFLPKLFSLGGEGYAILLAGSELVIYFGLALVVMSRISVLGTLTRTHLDGPIVGLLVAAVMSAWLSGSDWLATANSTRNLLRYVALYYIVVNIRVSVYQIRRLLWLIALVGIVQGLIVVSQVLGGASFVEFFLPREVNAELFGQSIASRDLSYERVGAVFGTLGQPGALAAYTLVPATVAWALIFGMPLIANRRAFGILSLLLTVCAVYFTYKRLMLLLVLGIPVLYGLHWNFKATIRLLLILAIPVLAVIAVGLSGVDFGAITTDAESRVGSFSFSSLMLELASGEYWRHSLENSRLWLLVEGIRATFLEGRLFGFGPDEQRALEAFAYSSHGRERVLDYFAYKDVFWIALTIHFGVLGLLCYWVLIFRTWRLSCRSATQIRDPQVRAVLIMCSVYVIVFFWGSFAERLPVLRVPAFFFWLCCALVVKLAKAPRMTTSQASGKSIIWSAGT